MHPDQTPDDDGGLDVDEAVPATLEPDALDEPTLPVTEHAKGAPAWAHAAADTMHGWAAHAHHTGEPMQLTADDYAAAVRLATRRNAFHPPALSPHHPAPPTATDEE